MRIAVISDLHLGIRDRADRFGHCPEAFGRFLDHLEAHHERIIIGGDLYETWQGARYGRIREALQAIQRAYPRLTTRLREPPYELIYGNHDAVLANEGIPREIEVRDNGLTLLFTHGHRWDPLLKRTTPVAYSFSWSTGWLIRGDDPVRRTVSQWRERFERRFLYNVAPKRELADARDANCPYQRGALKLLEEVPELNVIVCGHTHVPVHCRTPYGDYLNSGAVAGGHLVWVSIDTQTRSWELMTHDTPFTPAETP
ncbi:MAG: metallophosphoesterase family protein [Myxococcota bacterium]